MDVSSLFCNRISGLARIIVFQNRIRVAFVRKLFYEVRNYYVAHDFQQSWLTLASAVAHTAASDSSQRLPLNGDSKPTKYHYYPHNQHLYLLPECATQQVSISELRLLWRDWIVK